MSWRPTNNDNLQSLRRLTSKQNLQLLEADLATIRNNVDKSYGYIDTIVLWTPHYNKDELNMIKRTCRGDVFPRKPKVPPFSFYYSWQEIILQLPRQDALETVNEELCFHFIKRFDFAVDLVPASGVTARDLQKMIASRITHKWPSKHPGHDVGDTIYLESADARRIVVIYSDKPSKIYDVPVCHIEFRYKGADICRSHDIHKMPDLWTFDLHQHFDHEVRFSRVDVGKLDRLIEHAAGPILRLDPHHTIRKHARFPYRHRHALCGMLAKETWYALTGGRNAEPDELRHMVDWDKIPSRRFLERNDDIPAELDLASAMVHVPARAMIKDRIIQIWP